MSSVTDHVTVHEQTFRKCHLYPLSLMYFLFQKIYFLKNYFLKTFIAC